MPLPRRLAEFNRRGLNSLMLHLAGWAPGFAIVYHVGRATGRKYQTPVNVFSNGDRYLFALTYGQGDWVKNVVSAGECSIRTKGSIVKLIEPRLYEDTEREGVPAPVRWVLSLIDVEEFLLMRSA